MDTGGAYVGTFTSCLRCGGSVKGSADDCVKGGGGGGGGGAAAMGSANRTWGCGGGGGYIHLTTAKTER